MSAFLDVLARLRLGNAIPFTKRLAEIHKSLRADAPLARVHHPLTGFAYVRWNLVIAYLWICKCSAPLVQRRSLRFKRKSALFGLVPGVANRNCCRRASLPPEQLADVHFRWAW